jgi:hypothetical protein
MSDARFQEVQDSLAVLDKHFVYVESEETFKTYDLPYMESVKKPYKYNHGLPFSTKLAENLDRLKERTQKKKKASLIIIDGGVGEGKTTLAAQIGAYIQEAPIDFTKQIGMGGQQFVDKVKICFHEHLPVVIYDEAGDFNKRGALTKLNAMLNRVFETYRAFKIVVIVCLPNFNVLDNQLFENKIPRLLLHARGRTERQGNFRAYGLYRMLYIKHHMKNQKIAVKEVAYDMVQPNFVGHFLDLTPDRSKLLDKLSTAGKVASLAQGQVKLDGLIDYKELAQRFGRSTNWTRIAVSKLKIKPSRVIKKTRYFSENCIDALEDYKTEQQEKNK